jgi:mannosyltransferase
MDPAAAAESDPSVEPSARVDRSIPRWAFVLGAVVVAIGVVLRFVTRSDMWLDEALTVNLARLPFSQLHAALKQDGAPPLYYVVLHGWMSVFGTTDIAVRSLAGLISVVTLPVMWCCGRRLGRPGPPGPIADDPPSARLVAWLTVLVTATSPFAIRYATENRMYSLVIFEVALGYLVLRRAFERPSFGRWAAVTLVAAAMLYTQYWTIYLLVVVGVATLYLAVRGTTAAQRHAARGAVLALVVAAITFAPWLPTFLYQQSHTGTPWGDGQPPFLAFRTALDQFANGTSLFHAQANVLVFVLVVLCCFGAFGRAAGRTRVDIELRTWPTVRWEFLTFITALAFSLTVAWIGNSAFDGRYASIVFPLFVLVVAVGFLSFGSRPLLFGALALVVGFGFAGAARNITDQRTQAAQAADVLHAEAKPGDVVVYCPDQLAPAVNRLLDHAAVKQITYPSFDGPSLVDWVDYRDKIARSDPTRFAQRVADATGAGSSVWLVFNGGYQEFEERCGQLYNALATRFPRQTSKVTADESFFEGESVVRFERP